MKNSAAAWVTNETVIGVLILGLVLILLVAMARSHDGGKPAPPAVVQNYDAQPGDGAPVRDVPGQSFGQTGPNSGRSSNIVR